MNKIKELRTAQIPKMSQEKLAKLLGVGRTTVTMWENGSNEPDNAMLVKLAEIFGVSTDYLLGHDEPPSPSAGGTAPVDQEQIMAAFWGGDQELSDEDRKSMWADVKNFAAFIAQKKKQEKQQHD